MGEYPAGGAARRIQVRMWMLVVLTAVSAVFMALAGPARGLGMTVGLIGLVVLPWWIPREQGGKLRAAFGVALGAPLLLELSLVVMWGVAWGILGHMPRESVDDPSTIHLVVDLLGGVAWLLVLLLPASFGVSIWLGILIWGVGPGRLQTRLFRVMRSVVLAMGGWVAAFVLSRVIDGLIPVNLGSWLID